MPPKVADDNAPVWSVSSNRVGFPAHPHAYRRRLPSTEARSAQKMQGAHVINIDMSTGFGVGKRKQSASGRVGS